MRHLVKSFFALFVLLTTAANAWSADGRILSFEGDVRVNGQLITSKTELQREDVIVTATGASVKIVLSDNSVLDLDSDSEIKLSDYSYSPSEPENNKSDINVVEGTLRYVSGLIAKEDPEDIGFTAGNSTIGVRGSFTEIEVDGVVVNVEAMIGEATLTEQVGGEKDTIVIPTGQATTKDPSTGAVLLAPSTASNKVNDVVHAIVAAAPDASAATPTDEGCSESGRPLRTTAQPNYDPETAAAIAAQLEGLSDSELMMVMAVLINNARHLCIDAKAIANTLGLIITLRPNLAGELVYIAVLLDPDNTNLYVDAALAAAPDQANNIQQAVDNAKQTTEEFNRTDRPEPPVTEEPENEVPPGGGNPPSPE